MLDNNVNVETEMEWTTFIPQNRRTRSNSNESEKISLETAKSPSKKQKSARPDNEPLLLPEMEILKVIGSKVKVNET